VVDLLDEPKVVQSRGGIGDSLRSVFWRFGGRLRLVVAERGRDVNADVLRMSGGGKQWAYGAKLEGCRTKMGKQGRRGRRETHESSCPSPERELWAKGGKGNTFRNKRNAPSYGIRKTFPTR